MLKKRVLTNSFELISPILPFVCAYWKIWATSSLSDLIQIISQSGLLDSEWVREVLGLSPNVGLEALAESLNIPEGSQDKDSLKVLTELPRSQSMKVVRRDSNFWLIAIPFLKVQVQFSLFMKVKVRLAPSFNSKDALKLLFKIILP